MRRTKIVCTIGPASSSEETVRAMIRAGMDVARLNFSHGTHESHATNIATVRKVAAEEGKVVAILQDLQGPRIRIGGMPDGGVLVDSGASFTLTTREVVGDPGIATVRGAPLPQDVRPGDRILLDDGSIEMQVLEAAGTEVHCRVVVGGTLKANKGVNVPGRTLSVPTITDKDLADLAFGLEQGVDYVAMSFVRSAEDVRGLKELIARAGADTPVMAKIEKHEAVAVFDEILEVVEAVMVARGDLGIEMAAEEVPILQKMIIHRCNEAGKPVITATQMLDSMIRNPRPTRAEVNDVANAILDGTDATMLSGETAAGAYPVEAVATMARIALTADRALPYEAIVRKTTEDHMTSVTDAIANSTCAIAHELGVKAVIASTISGHTARAVASHRPAARIIATTPLETTLRRLALVWGVTPIITPPYTTTDEMIHHSVEAVRQAGVASDGDLVIITAGLPAPAKGRTNLLKLHVIGEPT